jgi:hypothetical protein
MIIATEVTRYRLSLMKNSWNRFELESEIIIEITVFIVLA